MWMRRASLWTRWISIRCVLLSYPVEDGVRYSSTMLQYYGFNASLLPFCNILETQNFTEPALESGIASTQEIDVAFESFLTALAEIDYDSIPGGADDPVADRSWMWQYCSEYGASSQGAT